MKDFRGTQGNWEVDPDMDTVVRSTNSDNGTVAECHNGTLWGNDEDVKRANAQLIAAAPELLEALQELVEKHDNRPNGCIAPFENGDFLKAREAINKALGE